jgi:hypothetical protein
MNKKELTDRLSVINEVRNEMLCVLFQAASNIAVQMAEVMRKRALAEYKGKAKKKVRRKR